MFLFPGDITGQQMNQFKKKIITSVFAIILQDLSSVIHLKLEHFFQVYNDYHRQLFFLSVHLLLLCEIIPAWNPDVTPLL